MWPALVLTDMMMPEMDGFALLAALRDDPATRTIPVIMLSARAGEEARIEGIEAGADDYLTKPFTARELVARVESQIKMAQMRQAAIEQENALTREIDLARQFAWETLEHIPEAFYTLDSDYRLTYLNGIGKSRALGQAAHGRADVGVYPMLLGTVVET